MGEHGVGLVLRAAKVFTPQRVIDDGVVLVEGKTIRAVGRSDEVMVPPQTTVMDVRPHIVAPGFIDLHVHGGNGSDFMDDTDADFETVTRFHAAGGTTALLATTCAAPIEDICRVLRRVRDWQARPPVGSKVVGAHVEGPFFNLEMRGCHLPEYVINPQPSALNPLLEHADAMRHLTIAPEIDGALDAIERLRSAGVSVAAAHSAATCEDVDAAMRRGLHHVTHLYNAMSVFVQRGPRRLPGLAETALVRDELTVELIADGFHVHPLRMQLAVKMKGISRVCLVTDAMRGAGMPDGIYAFGPRSGKRAFVRDGIAVMPEGTGFASSTIQMNRAVQVMVEQVGVSLADALTMASAIPARVIGIDHRKGALRAGMDADIVVLDEQSQVRLTMVEGEVVYRVESP
ncbi:MAG: N-acetylglucosamine-6-phosphate deacetylase [Abditibacteriales bacterium]|nr:N-acetylglucosamine-6-phosphate deacetylase [Abditibacteriales bacterium]MDW8367090.1 N-acetylglucosamine-6-phosphate deacetylase [Abditibacteriales bacterium]